MDENQFLKKMENLRKPDVNAEASRRQLKLTIMNAKRSAAWGVWFIAIPVLFLASVAIKYLFHWTWGVSDNLIEWMANMDQHAATAWITPVLFVLLPVICALANFLAVLHFMYDKTAKELLVTIKLKWLNIALAVVSVCIIGIILLYGLMETSAENASKKYQTESKK